MSIAAKAPWSLWDASGGVTPPQRLVIEKCRDFLLLLWLLNYSHGLQGSMSMGVMMLFDMFCREAWALVRFEFHLISLELT